MLAILLAGLLAVMAPSAFAADSDVSLEASIANAPDKGWYASGESVEIVGILSNSGDATSIQVDPSCNEVLRVWNDGNLIVDGTEICLGQSRGLDLDSSSTTEIEPLFWDLKDSDGLFVKSGYYDIELVIAGEDLSSTVSVHVQTPVSVPEGLEFEMIATARDGIHAQASPSIITARLHNTLPVDIDLDLEGCKLSLNSQLIGDCGPSTLKGHQIVTVTQIAVPLDSGLNEFSMSLGDGVLMTNLVIDAIEDEDEANWTGDLDNLDLSLILSGDGTYEVFDTFEPEITITNSGQEDISLDFTDTCRGETWVVDSAGRVVMDTLSFKECTDLDVQNLLTPNSQRTFSQPEWSFIDMAGCYVPSGDLTVIFEIPEHDLYGTDKINLDFMQDSYCQDESVEIIADISGDQEILVVPKIISSESFELNWFNRCGLETTLLGPNGEIETVFSECGFNKTFSMKFNEHQLDSVSMQSTNLEDGDYYLAFQTISEPEIRTTVSFTWPLIDEQVETEVNDENEVEEIAPRVVDGSWSATTNDFGVCWLLNSPDEGIITLAGASDSLSWTPEVGATGQYLVTESVPSTECAGFAAASFKVNEVYSQEIPVVQEDIQEEAVAPPAEETQESEISPVVITVGAVVASGGILSLLVALIATNESWRIPTTSAGLWLLALVGRTSETSDGRYQRGRLMGYLTANPGCHFRALMAALEMSNGQITHHLKVLEDEESIWRRPDGRLVRFYPYTSNLHPGIVEDELPLPPLSPDPNSLQGKILRLLDDDGHMKKYPTQAELAHRLDRSQQLVSHHLRTLQKFGLVQKQKMGVKNRYRLTREAVFLLDTTEV